jgi:alanine racemase
MARPSCENKVFVPQDARCYVEISRSRIAANYRAVCAAVGPQTQVMGVVKADAYGHGAIEVSRVLCQEGASWLAVSSVDEGVALRRAGIDCRILVMAGVMPWESGAVREFRLTPALHSIGEIAFLGDARRASDPLDVHLKIDTGMNRLGTHATAAEIANALAGEPGIRVEGLMSHFASAADFSSTQTDEQIRQFSSISANLAALGIRPRVTHCAGTNAVAYPRPGLMQTLVRPGHAIYGYVSPARGDAPAPAVKVAPALSWKTRIVAIKHLPAGARVGYGGSFVAAAPMRVAILAAGYADGISHRLSNKGKVIAGGRFAPIVGTVSMDLTTIDVTQSPHLRPGDEVTLLGREGDVSLDAQQIARTAGTISYNVLCAISARVRRFYVE